jgi:hypothetical protein
MIELAIFLKEHGYRPRQVQDFIPAPMDIATCMYWTGLDPITMKPVTTARRLKERGVQRALLQFFAPENWATVRDALRKAGREDLIGEGPECLIPSRPPPRPARRGTTRMAPSNGQEPDRDAGPGGARGKGGYRGVARDRGRGRRSSH